MDVRLVASDLDGTLFGPDKVPEHRTVEAINAIVDAGIIFAAVTGRSHFGGAARVISTGATVDWFIGSNGGHRLNMATGVLEERLLFTPTELDAITTELPAQIDGLGFGLEHEAGFTYDAAFHVVFPKAFDGGPRTSTTTWATNDVGKIFAAHPDLTSDQIIAATTPLVPPGTLVSTSGGSFVEFTPAGAHKAAGLSRLCDQLGISADQVIAFGDNNNDISMLKWAGRSVAMANGTDEARQAADEITASNLDFGVAQILETLIG